MPSQSQKTALKQGYITQKQYDKLPTKMLDGIIKHNRAKVQFRKSRLLP